MPRFSIIIPTFNRPELTAAAVASCLCQEFDDLEVVVVDDASTDETAATAASSGDPRVTVVRHAENLGHWQGRNTGVEHATGDWCLFLDSDEELLPGALNRIAQVVDELDASVGRVGFMYRYDTGATTPDPPLRDETVDYAGFIAWLGRTTGPKDFLPCTRRDTFEQFRYPTGRRFGVVYHLDFSRAWRTRFVPEVVALAKTQIPGRNTVSPAGRMVRDAASAAAVGEAMMADHADAAEAADAAGFCYLAAGAARWCFLAGRRRPGLRFALRCLRHQPLSAKLWVLLLAGLLGPRAVAWSLVGSRALRSG